jgi:DNA-directed RNA polymerase beta subunit
LLQTSQYGYYCTNETPSGGHIGVTKNLSIFTAISIGGSQEPIVNWLFTKAKISPCQFMTTQRIKAMVPVYINGGIIGYTRHPQELAVTLQLLKRTGCLPPFSSCGFNIQERKVFLYNDDGRPLRPLIHCQTPGNLPPLEEFKGKSWVRLVIGKYHKEEISLESNIFYDPWKEMQVQNCKIILPF